MPAKRRFAGASGALAALVLTGSPVAISAARADDCSGIMCLFHGREAPPQPQPAPPPAAAAENAPQAATADPADAAPRAKPKPKPVAIVTIAADPSEASRLKPLAAALPRPHVRIVDAKAGQGADFSLATSLDQGGSSGTARLFPEAMHVIAGDRIHALGDLDGKNVSFGAEGSAGQTVARKAFQAAGIKVSETPLELDNALDGLATGDLDAVVVVAPQPDARLKALHAPGLHLVAWPQAATPPDGASVATIDADAYSGLAKAGGKIAALTVDAVLVESQKGARQPAAKAFLGELSHHAAALGKRGFVLLQADSGRRVANNEPR